MYGFPEKRPNERWCWSSLLYLDHKCVPKKFDQWIDSGRRWTKYVVFLSTVYPASVHYVGSTYDYNITKTKKTIQTSISPPSPLPVLPTTHFIPNSYISKKDLRFPVSPPRFTLDPLSKFLPFSLLVPAPFAFSHLFWWKTASTGPHLIEFK